MEKLKNAMESMSSRIKCYKKEVKKLESCIEQKDNCLKDAFDQVEVLGKMIERLEEENSELKSKNVALGNAKNITVEEMPKKTNMCSVSDVSFNLELFNSPPVGSILKRKKG